MSQMTNADKCAGGGGRGSGAARRLGHRVLECARAAVNNHTRPVAPPPARRYFLHVEPGFDAAFAVALAALVDELFHDQQQ